MRIEIDDLSRPQIAQLLSEHIDDMLSVSPPESVHTLDLEGLKAPEITFWTVWEGNNLAGCGGLKELDKTHAEIKSMRSSLNFRGRGVGSMILRHIIDVAISRGYKRLSLETGSMEFFIPAHQLYEKYGFDYCEPFADYVEDPHSVFMTREL